MGSAKTDAVSGTTAFEQFDELRVLGRLQAALECFEDFRHVARQQRVHLEP